ncbi:hypothetical protein Tco_0111040 [Tanacetum coccineum]
MAEKALRYQVRKRIILPYSGCCAQVLWMRSQVTDYGFGFNKIHSTVITLAIMLQQSSTIQIKASRLRFIHQGTSLENGLGKRSIYRTTARYSENTMAMKLHDMSGQLFKNILYHTCLDDALVAPGYHRKDSRLENAIFALSSDITSKEATLQVVYDVLKLTPFYKLPRYSEAPEIYMQEIWASAYVTIEREGTDEDDITMTMKERKVAGANVSVKMHTDQRIKENEAVKDSNTDLDGRDKVMTDVEDTHVTLTPVNPDEDNFSEFRQTNQYADALSSIPGTVDQYLANKMQEAVDVAVQLKYDRFREESNSANQQFLDSIDEGMKKIIKDQVKKEVSKVIPKIGKLVIDQLESEVLVRSSKEAHTSYAVAANLSELELKKILIDKMEANNSINRSDIQRQLYQSLI